MIEERTTAKALSYMVPATNMGCDMVKLVFCPSHSVPERPAGTEQVEDAGRCYSTVVKHMPCSQEVMDSIFASCWPVS